MMMNLSDRQPLRRWTLKGFKSVVDATIEFRPLSVIVGANSSGKSSLIQSMLLLAQAAQVGSRGAVLPLNGPIVSLGGFEDVASVMRKPREISMAGLFSLPDASRRRASVQPSEVLSADESPIELLWSLRLRGSPADDPGAARIRALELMKPRQKSGNDEDVSRGFRLRASVPRAPKASETQRASRDGGLDGRLQTGWGQRFDVHDAVLQSALPTGFLIARPENEVLFEQWLRAATAREVLRRPRPADSGRRARADYRRERDLAAEGEGVDQAQLLIDELVGDAVHDISTVRAEHPGASTREMLRVFSARWKARRQTPQALDLRLLMSLADEIKQSVIEQLGEGDERWVDPDFRQASEVIEAASRLRDFLATRVLYLGPLREAPHAVYAPAPTVSTASVGTQGEYVTSVLHAFGEQMVVCPYPDGTTGECSLSAAVATWLEEFDVGKGLATRSLGRPGLELRLQERHLDRELDLTNVGVGVSQLLPVVVLCLLAPVGSLILLEQPELHLHPALQQRLGDFLLACSLSGRQLIVETHSDYIVSRLRRRIAEDPKDEIRRYLALIYAERFGGASNYRLVEPNEYGGIEDWPHGFFDQGADESQAILRAAMAKREASD
jgi:predicted ATPase